MPAILPTAFIQCIPPWGETCLLPFANSSAFEQTLLIQPDFRVSMQVLN